MANDFTVCVANLLDYFFDKYSDEFVLVFVDFFELFIYPWCHNHFQEYQWVVLPLTPSILSMYRLLRIILDLLPFFQLYYLWISLHFNYYAIIRKIIENVTRKLKNNMSVARILFYSTIYLSTNPTIKVLLSH